MIDPSERDDLATRAVALLRSHLAGDGPAVAALVGEDSDRLLPVVVGLLTTAWPGGPAELEERLQQWQADRLDGLG